MDFSEVALQFDCQGSTLLGIVAEPLKPAQVAVLVIVGGPQYRAGSHRQFLLMSRVLAANGFAVLRFDYRGMGDGEGIQRNFESVSADIGAAIQALQSHMPVVKRIVLWGLCDGASAALLYWTETRDVRIAGLCLLNPWVRSEASYAKTQVKHYYTQRLRQKEFWLKLMSGKVALGALGGFVQKVRASATAKNGSAPASEPFQNRMATGWHSFSGPILLILSEDDYTAKEFIEHADSHPAWNGYQTKGGLTRRDLIGFDHTFSNAEARKRVEALTLNWLETIVSNRLIEAPPSAN